MPNSPRLIQVKARDAQGKLLPGTTFEWTEDGAARGRIEHSEGHATLRATSQTSIVEVVATYEGQQERQRLAETQISCELHFRHVNKSKSTGWLNSTVLGALIAAIPVVIVGYWQFVAKDESKDTVDVIVLVKDQDTQAPISGAKVNVEGSGLPSPTLSDGQGRTVFRVKKPKSAGLNVTAQKDGYANGSSTVTEFDAPAQVLLKATGASGGQSPTSGSRATTGGSAAAAQVPVAGRANAAKTSELSGTWRVVLEGNLALKRVLSGSVQLDPAVGGRFSFSARLKLDGEDMQLTGDASRTDSTLFLRFSGQDESNSTHWKGTGEFNVRGDKLEGVVTDKDGKEVPLKLARA